MWTGILAADLLLGDVASLKEKRSVVRPLVAELSRRFAVSAAETGHIDLYRRTQIGLAVVSGERRHCVDVLDRCERVLEGHPEFEVLSTMRRLVSEDDLMSGLGE